MRRRAIAQAKYQLGQSMRFVGQQCIQLHGGIGVTDEYIASHYFKRLTVMEMSWGDSLHHLGDKHPDLNDRLKVVVLEVYKRLFVRPPEESWTLDGLDYLQRKCIVASVPYYKRAGHAIATMASRAIQ